MLRLDHKWSQSRVHSIDKVSEWLGCWLPCHFSPIGRVKKIITVVWQISNLGSIKIRHGSTVYVSCRLLLVEVTLHMCDSLAGFIAACTMLLITWCHMLNQLDQHVSCFGCPPSLCATNRYSCSILPGINIRVSSACQSEDAQDIFMQLGEFRILLVVISCQTCSPCQVTISQLGGWKISICKLEWLYDLTSKWNLVQFV